MDTGDVVSNGGDEIAIVDGSKILKAKIESLEAEKDFLATEFEEAKAKILTLSKEIEAAKSSKEELKLKLEAELEEFEENKRTLEEVAKRNVQLETDIMNLQQDFISAMHAGEEASAEITEVRKMLGQAEVKLEEMKKEKSELERQVRELERKVGVMEVREKEEKSKRLRLEEEIKEQAGIKDSKIKELKERLDAAEDEIKSMKETKSESRRLNGIEIGNRDVGINASRLIAGSVGGAVLVVAAVSAIVLVSKTRKG